MRNIPHVEKILFRDIDTSTMMINGGYLENRSRSRANAMRTEGMYRHDCALAAIFSLFSFELCLFFPVLDRFVSLVCSLDTNARGKKRMQKRDELLPGALKNKRLIIRRRRKERRHSSDE